MTERSGVWAKIGIALVPFLVAGFITVVTMNERVAATAQALDAKANRETVNAQFDAILRELQAVRSDLAELKARR